MKLHATIREIRDGSYKLLSVGYCEMQHLLQYQSPVAYTAGTYGWNFDAYQINDVTICTGYRGMPKNKRMNDNWQLVREYEKKAEKIIYSVSNYQDKIEIVNGYLSELLKKLAE